MNLRNTFFLHGSQARLYWALRGSAGRASFQVRRKVFSARQKVRESTFGAKTFIDLLRLSLGPIVLAGSIATTLQLIDTPLTESLDPYLGHHLKALTVTPDIYGTLLATIAGAGAVLIGLYFAATTAIAGAIYSRVPNDIRDLLAGERIGNFYMRILALITYLSVVLLAFRAIGLAPIKLAIPIMSLAAGVALIAFIQLGARAFNLFDPTTLSIELLDQLRRNYSRARAGSYRWLDPSFQKHAHTVAHSALDAFETLSDLCAKEVHLSGRPFLALCRYLLAFLIVYESNKKQIPTESRWFAKRFSHQDWYRTEDSTTSLMLEAAGRLQPKEISDPNWIESRVLPILSRCLLINLEHARYDIALELLSYIDKYVGAVSNEGDVALAHEVLQKLTADCNSLLFKPLSEGADREALERLAIVDSIAAMTITVLLRYSDFTTRLDRSFIANAVRLVNWKAPRSIYETRLPRNLLTQLEWLRPRIEFEISSEGYRISRDWYLTELVCQPACQNAKLAAEVLLGRIPQLLESWFAVANAARLHWLASTIISREAEFWNKVDRHLCRLEEQWADLNSERRVDGLAWPKLDFEALAANRQKQRKELLKRMSAEATALSFIERPDDYPDFAGQFLHAVGDAVLDAMINNDSETVDALFPGFFFGSLRQFDRLRSHVDLSDWRGEIAFKVALAPVVDLLDVSGFGLVFGALHHNDEMTSTIKSTWDQYLGGPNRATPQFLSAALSLSEAGFGLAHRSLIRTAWQQKVQQRLRKVDSHQVPRGRFSSTTVVAHKSALIRVLARSEFLLHDGVDAFISEYLLKREDGKEIDFGYTHMEFARMVAREEQRSGSMGAGREMMDEDDQSESI